MKNKYRLKITGKDLNRYINYLIDQKISLYNVKMTNKSIILLVDDKGYKDILSLKTSYKIELLDEFGKVKYKSTIKKYSIMLICIFLGLILLLILSNLIFDISVKHSKSEIRELILNDLKEYGIEKYHFKVSYKEKEQIIKKILKKEHNRLEWMEIDNIGTKYIIKVEERIKNEPKVDNHTQHIVAKKDAMILEIHADAGEIVVKKNDYVKKGDILISGFISKDEEIKKKVKAIGIVYGEVWYQVSFNVPNVYKEIKYTSNIKKRFKLKFLNKEKLLFDYKPYKTYKVKEKELLSNKILPIKLSYSTVIETKEIKKRYNTKEGEKELLKLAEDKLKAKIGVNSKIISKKILKKKEKDSKIEIDIFCKVKEDMTETQNIDNIDIKEQEGEKNGADG